MICTAESNEWMTDEIQDFIKGKGRVVQRVEKGT
jgi:hypothetical protein